MEKMTKKEKFKKFVDDHHETIAKVAVYTTMIVGSIAIIARAVSVEEEKKLIAKEKRSAWVKKENAWLDEKEAEGTDVYLLSNLSYLFIPKETEREIVEVNYP